MSSRKSAFKRIAGWLRWLERRIHSPEVGSSILLPDAVKRTLNSDEKDTFFNQQPPDFVEIEKKSLQFLPVGANYYLSSTRHLSAELRASAPIMAMSAQQVRIRKKPVTH